MVTYRSRKNEHRSPAMSHNSRKKNSPTEAKSPARRSSPKTALVVLVVVAAGISAWAFYFENRSPARAESTGAAGQSAQAPISSPFAPTIPNQTPPPGKAPEGMVWIPGGEFSMGSEDAPHMDANATSCGLDQMPDARPIHRVYVDGFWMDATEVTNEQFEKFVKATGYVTIAEQTPKAEDFPGAPPENLVAGSTVFTPTPGPVPLNDHYQWWRYEPGVNWRHPQGPQSDLKGRAKYPIVHIAYDDAAAYAQWAGKRLPTEAEFEFAARGGLSGKVYAWGDEFHPGGKFMANTFQGTFPVKDTGEDGFAGVAPVAQFPPNGYGDRKSTRLNSSH